MKLRASIKSLEKLKKIEVNIFAKTIKSFG